MFPKRGKAIFKGVNHTFELIVFLYLIPFAWKYLLSAIANGQTSPAMGIPMYYVQGSTVGGIYPVSDPGYSRDGSLSGKRVCRKGGNDMPAVVVFLIFCDLSDPCDSGIHISRNCIGTSGSGRSVLYSKRNLCHPFYAWRNRQFPFCLQFRCSYFQELSWHGGGISRKLFDVFAYFMGKRTAGMPCAVVVTCLFYEQFRGSAPATVAAVGSMTIPILMEMGYDKKFSTALVAVAGGLGVIIPPSIPFIMYGMASGASVSDLFIAGIIPGVMIGGLLMVYAIYYCKKHGEDQEKKLAMVGKLHDKGLFKGVKGQCFFALLSPVIILGCIYTGVASPTEAAVISVFTH